MMHGMHGSGYGIWMVIFWVVLAGVGIYLLVTFISSGNKNVNHERQTNRNRPLETLQERLAKGEIDEEEYERLKMIIKQDQEK